MGLLGQTVTLGETLLEQDVQSNPYYAELVPGMQAQLSVPIKREGRVIGAIVLESETTRELYRRKCSFYPTTWLIMQQSQSKTRVCFNKCSRRMRQKPNLYLLYLMS